MTLHLLVMSRPGHSTTTNEGAEIPFTIHGEHKIPDPHSETKLDPVLPTGERNHESYFAITHRFLHSIYETQPGLLDDKLVVLYTVGLGAAVDGAVDAIIANGFEVLRARWDNKKEQYVMQPRGILFDWEIPLSERIDESRPVVPLSSLRPTGP